MKMRTIARKLSAVMLAGAMLASMGMTSSAEGVTGNGEGAVTAVPVTKIVTTDGNTYAPNTTFTIEVATAAAGEYDGNVVYEGVAGGLSGTTITSTPGESTAESYTNNASLTVNPQVFTKPGVFHYTVKETAGDYEGITYSTISYDVYLYVYNGDNNDLYVGYVASVQNGVKANLSFTNDYGKEYDKTHYAVITKEVSGDQAVSGAKFPFTVKVNGADGEKYKVVVTSGETSTTLSVTSGGTIGADNSIMLGNGDTITIYGLTENDSYTVTEVSANQDGYKTTIDSSAEAAGTITDNAKTDGAGHTFHNVKNAITPTGIVMTIAPYILLVAVAAALAVLFLRRRREEI